MKRVASLTLSVSAALVIAGCSSGGGTSGAQMPPPPPPMTAVTLMLSSTANDQLSEFQLTLQGISLTSATGNTVSLLAQSRGAEFIHVNGTSEPLLTAQIPPGLYTAASVTIGGAQFTCVALNQLGGLDIAIRAYGQTPTANVTVTLPAPIAVSGDSMGLSLNLLASQSAGFDSCAPDATGTLSPYTITPTFSLSGFALASSSAATADNGAVMELNGQVTALDSDAGGFQIALPTTSSVHVAIDSATLWQGVAAVTDLTQGAFVDIDGALRGDGSVVATRVVVADPAAVNVRRGPLLFASNGTPVLDMLPRQAQGHDGPVDVETYSFSGTTFGVSAALPNLQALPFTPSFTAQNMVPGQAVYLSAPAFLYSGPYYAVADTITLVPQSVDGTVTGVTTSGDFTVYSVSLAPYDLFPLLAAQPGQTTLLSNPGAIEVYADTSTAMLTAAAPATGDTLRFYGLVFNDNGTLRMDCAQVSAGVAVLPPSAGAP